MKNITGLQWSAASGMKEQENLVKCVMHKCLPDAVARMVILFFDRVAAQRNISNPRVACSKFPPLPPFFTFCYVLLPHFVHISFYSRVRPPFEVHDLRKLIRIFLVALSIFVSLSEMKIKLKFVGSPEKLNRTTSVNSHDCELALGLHVRHCALNAYCIVL